jgi:hypothetical protein
MGVWTLYVGLGGIDPRGGGGVEISFCTVDERDTVCREYKFLPPCFADIEVGTMTSFELHLPTTTLSEIKLWEIQ